MTRTTKSSIRVVGPALLRLIALTLIVIATPSIAHADVQTQMGLDNLAKAVNSLAAAVAFVGIAIAVVIHLAFKSQRQAKQMPSKDE